MDSSHDSLCIWFSAILYIVENRKLFEKYVQTQAKSPNNRWFSIILCIKQKQTFKFLVLFIRGYQMMLDAISPIYWWFSISITLFNIETHHIRSYLTESPTDEDAQALAKLDEGEDASEEQNKTPTDDETQALSKLDEGEDETKKDKVDETDDQLDTLTDTDNVSKKTFEEWWIQLKPWK